MTKKQNNKQYDLEDRTEEFARNCRDFIKKLPKTTANFEYGKQLIRSSSSQAANYIEANEALSKKDFIYRIRVCRKETKETCLWLKLCEPKKDDIKEQEALIQEAVELRKIFNAILEKSQ
jgi:four helix bundle protein